MKKLIKVTLLVLLIIGTSSCMWDGVRGDGNVVINKRKISNDFVRINASRGLDIYITKSKHTSLEVEADENLHELITTEVRDGTLHITATKNIWGASAKKIHLSADFINEIKVSSGAEVYSENTFSSDKLVINASSGAHANMDLNVDDLRCEGSSGSEMKLSGEAVEFTVSTSSGSNIDAYRLSARSCNANATSGSNVRLRVTETFVGKATSGAGIKYKGHPKRVDKSNNSGASINNVEG
jgi:hypothetical protein